MLAVGRLLRLSLSPSAAADVAAGIVFAGAAWPSGPDAWLLIVSSLCVYHGGMALNDWADRARDAITVPRRPLPSGQIRPGTALALAIALLGAGPLLALTVHPDAAVIAGGIVALVVAYDLGLRGPVRGPLLLGLCRAANLAMGIWYGRLVVTGFDRSASAEGLDRLVAPLLLYGFYVFVVSRLGRLEDGEDPRPLGRRPTRLLAIAAFTLLAIPLLALPDVAGPDPLLGDAARHVSALLLAAIGAAFLVPWIRRREPWTRPAVRGAMGTALRGLLPFTAALAVLRGSEASTIVSSLILAGIPVGIALRRVFPPS